MDFKEYQARAEATAIYPSKFSLLYPALGLAGEAGEVCEKIKKIIRDDKNIVDERKEIARELGDVLWYIAALSRDIGYTLEGVADLNIEKLESRQARGKLQGSGDNR